MRYIAVVAMIALLTKLLPLVLAWFRIRALRIRGSVRVERVEPEALPSELSAVFDAAAAQLADLGFVHSHAGWSEALVANEPRRPQHVLLHHPTATYATVCPPVFHNGRRSFAVAFTTVFRSGHVLTTVDAVQHLSPLQAPGHDLRDHYLNDVKQQWAAHEQDVSLHAPADPPVRLSADEQVAQEADAIAAAVEAARQAAVLGPPAHGTYRFTAAAAWRAARTLVEGSRRVERMERAAAADRKPLASEVSLAADVYAYETAEAQRHVAAMPSTTRLRWFAATALASGLALGLIVSWTFVPALLLVLLVHELGHIGGMRLFGYRDRRILFLPFIGAAAIGEKEDAKAFQRLVVLLLGPLPGIVIGLLCVLVASATGWRPIHEIGLLFLILNYLNLLPVTPLDGGRIVELLFLQRTPRAGAAFHLASAAAAGLAGLAFDDLLLVGLSMVLLISLPVRWRIADAAARARNRLTPDATRADRIRAAFLALDRGGRVSAGARGQLARGVVDHLVAPAAPAHLSVAGGALYALLLAVPIVVTTALLIPNRSIAHMCPDARDARTLDHDLGRALRDVCRDAVFTQSDARAQWNDLVARGGRSLAVGDSTLAMQYFRLAHTAATLEFDVADPRRVATRRMIQDLVAADDARAMAAAAAAAADGDGDGDGDGGQDE